MIFRSLLENKSHSKMKCADWIQTAGSGTTPVVLTVLGLVLLALATTADPLTRCPNYKGNFYMADHLNSCVYYWCVDGQRLGGALRCPLGTGVSAYHRSNKSPCRIAIRSCARFGPRAGIDPSTPPPTTRKPTDPPLAPENITISPDITEITETTGAEDVTTAGSDVTTEEVTEDPGSGEDEDLMPVGGGTDGDEDTSGPSFSVHSDMRIDGGLKIAATSSLGVCLQACSLLSGVCAGVDFEESISSCVIHTQASECTDMTSLQGSIHIRLTAC